MISFILLPSFACLVFLYITRNDDVYGYLFFLFSFSFLS